MGTLSVKMPDEEIEKLERLAEMKGETKSSFMRELAERELNACSISGLWSLVGILSDEEAEDLRESVEAVREEMTGSLERRLERT